MARVERAGRPAERGQQQGPGAEKVHAPVAGEMPGSHQDDEPHQTCEQTRGDRKARTNALVDAVEEGHPERH